MNKSRKHTSTNRRTMSRYAVATSVIISFGPTPVLPGSRPKAMFLAGPLLKGDAWEAIADLAEERENDIVCLEFGSSVGNGPKNISVLEHCGDKILHWGECALWSRGHGDISVILPEGCNFAFGYDGQHMVRMTGAPTSNLAEGFARARVELREVARRVTGSTLDQLRSKLH